MFDDVFRLVQKRKSLERIHLTADGCEAQLPDEDCARNAETENDACQQWSNMKQHEAAISIYFNLFHMFLNVSQKIQKAFEIEILFHPVVEGPVAQGSY